MIVKNEAHCIATCLESVKPHINYWVICDTGSTDNTEKVVKECLKGIPGEYYKHKWYDFSTNRNMAITLSKSKADYTLMLDADDYLVVDDPSTFSNLNELAYRIKILHGNLDHYRPQLISNSVNYRYVGVVHEYLELPPHIPQTILPNCHIAIRPVGHRSMDPAKYIKDAEVLEKALKNEPNNSRYVFYCAQSYRDAGNLDKALSYYMKRTEMIGYDEEKYCSFLEAGKIMEKVNPVNIQNITITYLKAYECNPNRVESLFYLAAYYRKINLLGASYLFAKLGSEIPKPVDALFLEPDCYDWRIWDELAVAGYWLGKRAEAAEINKKLLANPNLPEYTRPRIIDNLVFCQQ
jgi:glycosyltransferase involved in cell wall biosynthesis